MSDVIRQEKMGNVTREEITSNVRTWLFRGLVVVAAAFLVVTWFMDWWTGDCAEISSRAVVVHPWGLEDNLGFMSFAVDDARMPGWFAPAMFAYLGLALLALLISLFVKDRVIKLWKFKLALPSLVIGLVGLSYILVPVVAILYMTVRMKGFYGGIPLQGHITIPLEAGSMEGHITTSLEIGYYLAYAAGALLVILAVLRNRILGRKLA
jgi:hypothetical protein